MKMSDERISELLDSISCTMTRVVEGYENDRIIINEFIIDEMVDDFNNDVRLLRKRVKEMSNDE